MKVSWMATVLCLACAGPDKHLAMQLQTQSDRLHDDCERGAALDDCPGHRRHLVCMLEKVEAMPRESEEERRAFVTQCRDSRYSVNEYNQSCGDPKVTLSATLDDVCGQVGVPAP